MKNLAIFKKIDNKIAKDQQFFLKIADFLGKFSFMRVCSPFTIFRWNFGKKPKYWLYIANISNFLPKNPSIYNRWPILFRPSLISQISTIFQRYFPIFSSLIILWVRLAVILGSVFCLKTVFEKKLGVCWNLRNT